MMNECPQLVRILRKYKNSDWEPIYKAAVKLDNSECCSDKYDKEIINGLEYSLLEGTNDGKLSQDCKMIIYKKLLIRYFKFGYKYHPNIKDILLELQNEKYVPEWYWYFKVKYSFESSNRTINRKVKFFKESLSEYYISEGQRAKNLYTKFDKFLSNLKLNSVEDVEYCLEREMEISSKLKKTFKKYRNKLKPSDSLENKESIDYVNIDHKVLLIGECKLNDDIINEVFKEHGINPKKVDLITEFDTDNFDFNTLKNSSKYSCVILGPIPHSVKGLQGYNSISQRIRTEEGFPHLIDIRKDKIISKEAIHIAVEEVKEFIS